VDPARLEEQATALVAEPFARRQRLLPVAVRRGRLVVVTDEPGNTSGLAELASLTGNPVEVAVTTKGDFDAALEAAYRDQYRAISVQGLMAAYAGLSSNPLVHPRGLAIGMVVLGALGAALIAWPLSILASIMLLLAAVFAGYHLALFALAALRIWRREGAPGAGDEPISDRDLPVYTVLMPLSGADRLRERLSAGIERVDYPRAKLDIKLCVRENDTSTLEALRGMTLPAHYDCIVVPAGGPRTRSYLLNYGLLHARGDLVTAFDVDEQPEASQLVEAAVALAAAGDAPACAVAGRRIEGTADRLLRWAGLDHGLWQYAFGLNLLRALAPQELRLATLHFRTSVLLAIGGYDVFSFAEDGGIGLRLPEAGARVVRLDSHTRGPASIALAGWTGGETRRWRGGIQTLLVQWRRPGQMWRRSGIPALVLLQLSSAVRCLAALGTLPLAATSALWLAAGLGMPGLPGSGIVVPLCVAGFAAGLLAHILAGAVLATARKARASVFDAVTAPAYLLLCAGCAWAALFGILSSRHTWPGARRHSPDTPPAAREPLHISGLEVQGP
jgi:cellulose synthase/poly-beta-1,6-N-acetylglucosamine synthase-like glycosyltransferase